MLKEKISKLLVRENFELFIEYYNIRAEKRALVENEVIQKLFIISKHQFSNQ